MKRLLGVAALLGVMPFATAQEPAKEPAATPAPGALFFRKFDLDKDGKVGWEEYQKVRSGFAALDVDRDGAITQADMTKIAERRQKRMQQEMQRRMVRRMHHAWRGRGFGFPGMQPGGFGRGAPGHGALAPPSGPQGWRPMGPMPPRGRGMRRGPGAPEGQGPPPPPRDMPPPPPRR
jgi:hypothetical protein